MDASPFKLMYILDVINQYRKLKTSLMIIKDSNKHFFSDDKPYCIKEIMYGTVDKGNLCICRILSHKEIASIYPLHFHARNDNIVTLSISTDNNCIEKDISRRFILFYCVFSSTISW